ncbi:unnamed protein product [Dovyalis caffra]|uniref:YqgF/RNase H-like domain-containing protein n=1 Tax=Dovyalis caffra TaxID=77055 RepID=A0AAV1SVR2_9ROSI|nr:unnamed protein product [Dovyalis caffra]
MCCSLSVSVSNSNQLLIFSKRAPTNLVIPNYSTSCLRLDNNKPSPRRLRAVLSIEEIPPNALRRKIDPLWRGGFSLGVDLGLSRSGLALSKGCIVRPLLVLELRGQKLELRLLEIAENEEVDEFIIGLPRSWDGKETPQSNKVRSVAGRFAVLAADSFKKNSGVGECTYKMNMAHQQKPLTTRDGASQCLILHVLLMLRLTLHKYRGLGKSTRQKKVDANAAVMVLERYFATFGEGTELVLPKQLDLQDKLQRGPRMDIDFYPE